MREIKFRAFGGVEPNMYYMDPASRTGMLSDLLESGTWKVMQFTGIKDKNGKDIYEGDILSVWHKDYADEKTIGKVWWFDCYYPAFDIYIPNKKFATGFEPYYNECNAFSLPDYVFEIIGNIYESPDLLNQPDQS